MKRLVVGLIVVAIAACGGDNPTGPVSLAGEYRLATMGGNSVPASVHIIDGDLTVTEISYGRLLFAVDVGFFALGYRGHLPGGPTLDAELPAQGPYTQTGSTVNIQLGGAIGERTGTLGRSGGRRTLTINVGLGLGVLVFRELDVE